MLGYVGLPFLPTAVGLTRILHAPHLRETVYPMRRDGCNMLVSDGRAMATTRCEDRDDGEWDSKELKNLQNSSAATGTYYLTLKAIQMFVAFTFQFASTID